VAALAFHLAYLVRFDPKPSSCGNTYVAPPKLTLATPRRLLLTGSGVANCRGPFMAAGTVTKEMIKDMADHAIVFAAANPEPEIWPWDAKETGAYVVATGRSDFPNQINNPSASLVFSEGRSM